jgi:outer membrane protein assembly factor BamB
MAAQLRESFASLLVPMALIVLTAPAANAQPARRLISQEDARHLGLERAWFAQVRLDRSRNHVERAILTEDRLTVLTSAGVVQEFNALTGETLWIATIGTPGYPSLGPTANRQFVALVNGSTLYVLDRNDGRPIMMRPVGGAPGAAPALAKNYVFVPLINGRIEGYSLDEDKLTPWYYQSFGRAMVPPLATAGSIVWTTDSGHLYVGHVDEAPAVRFRLETGSEIIAPPAYRKPFIYAAAVSGEMFAMDELTGARRWKYATGFTIGRAPAAVGERVFVTSQEPALHCVDASNGVGLWEAPDVAQFAAAGRNRVYGVDELGALVVLDATTGALVQRMPTDGTTNALVNDKTDRLYLVSHEGTVQCLHELGATQPLYHVVPEPETPPAEAADGESTEAAAGQPAESAASETSSEPPADAEAAPPAEDDDPFGAEETEDAATENTEADDAGAVEGAEAEMPAEEAEAGEDDLFGEP